MDHEALQEFVVEAHRNGYANSTPDAGEFGGKVITYRAGDFEYVDRYFGSRAFVGVEVVSSDGSPVWGMHYRGEPTDASVDHEPVYEFLRDVLGEVSLDHPYRGPETFVDEPFAYNAETTGDFTGFRGTEEIAVDNTTVYRGQFGGGIVD